VPEFAAMPRHFTATLALLAAAMASAAPARALDLNSFRPAPPAGA